MKDIGDMERDAELPSRRICIRCGYEVGNGGHLCDELPLSPAGRCEECDSPIHNRDGFCRHCSRPV